ncbi:Tn3 family transposase [Desulfosporosinus metallidurans]|uniref:Tn3 family transposase n=1 Tax=Desulfosporosinus metallidurans TaxID=1888891 RepID=UPI00094C085B
MIERNGQTSSSSWHRGAEGCNTGQNRAQLPSYVRQNKIMKALWELGNICRTLYPRIHSSVELRQSVQKALNRGEA